MSQRVLVTAFDAFGDSPINPSELVLKELPREIRGAEIITVVVPTVFGDSARRVTAAIDDHRPDVVIMLGQAAGRNGVTPERIAINIDDARIPDNAGNSPIDEPIIAHGPAAYFSTLPIKAITQSIKHARIPAAVSNTAGTFVCNHLFYHVLHHVTSHHETTRSGFIHIPAIPEQNLGSHIPTLQLDDIAKAIEIAIETTLTTETDVRIQGGSVH